MLLIMKSRRPTLPTNSIKIWLVGQFAYMHQFINKSKLSKSVQQFWRVVFAWLLVNLLDFFSLIDVKSHAVPTRNTKSVEVDIFNFSGLRYAVGQRLWNYFAHK